MTGTGLPPGGRAKFGTNWVTREPHSKRSRNTPPGSALKSLRPPARAIASPTRGLLHAGGAILVHDRAANSLRTHPRVRGFRAWRAEPGTEFISCDCGWGRRTA